MTTVDGLVDAVIDVQRSGIDRVRALARRGLEPQVIWVRDGYLDELADRVRWSEDPGSAGALAPPPPGLARARRADAKDLDGV